MSANVRHTHTKRDRTRRRRMFFRLLVNNLTAEKPPFISFADCIMLESVIQLAMAFGGSASGVWLARVGMRRKYGAIKSLDEFHMAFGASIFGATVGTITGFTAGKPVCHKLFGK